MKVISGIYKGRTIQGFNLEGTRPTMDRVKESVFGMIQDSVCGADVLDLFAGSGNLGIEAMSQGAKSCVFCDHHREAVQTIHMNLEKIGIQQVDVYKMDYKKCLEQLSNERKTFDIIFLDPPYQTDYIEKSLKLIDQYSLLKPSGIIVCESDSVDKIQSTSFSVVKERKYGDKMVDILRKM